MPSGTAGNSPVPALVTFVVTNPAKPRRLIEALKARSVFCIRQRLGRGLQSQMRQLRRSLRFLVTVGRVGAFTADEIEYAAGRS